MNAEEILQSDDFIRCSEFHGHVCPGLAIGFRAAKAGLAWLKENRAEDEELVAIVENDACSVDAVQVLTGCTFGKGNFIFKDFGKQVYYLLARNSGQGVRVALKPESRDASKKILELNKKIASGEATEADKEQMQAHRLQRIKEILESPEDELLLVEPAEMKMPEKARIFPSYPCDNCQEPTMSTRLEDWEGIKICRECLGKRSKKS